MNPIIKILMERDNMTYEEAKDLLDETREAMLDNPDEATDIMLEYLGLEMDYIFDIIG